MNSQQLKAGVAACALCVSGGASALQVTFNGFANSYQAVSINVSPDSPAERGSVSAGGFLTTVGSQSFVSYCVDLYQYLPRFETPNASYSESSAATFFGTKLDAVGRLFSGFSGGVNTALSSAAFQLALWEITNESGTTYDLGGGSARFTDLNRTDGNAVATAQGYLDQLGRYSNNVQLHVMTSGSRQDVVYATPVPEPSTYALMLAGLVGVSMLARRRQTLR